MSSDSQIIEGCYESLRRGDVERLLSVFDTQIEWIQPDGLTPYGLGGTRTGREGVRRFLDRLPDVFAELRREPEQFIGSDGEVVVLGTYHVRTPVGSSCTVGFTHIWQLRDAKVTRYEERYDTAPVRAALMAGADAAAGSAGQGYGPGISTGADQDRLVQLGLGFWPAKVLQSALELGVYTLLAEGPADIGTLTARLGLHERGARDFLDSQVALGLLERQDGQYRNTPSAALFLDHTKNTYIGGLLEMANEHWYRSWGNLTTALRTGEPQNNLGGEGGDPFAALYADPELTRRFQKAMTGGSQAASQALVRKFPFARYSSVVDVGCSEGVLLSTVLPEHPHLTGIGFDLPQVEPTFEETAERRGLTGRMRFVPGSFLTDPLPRADLVVLGRVLHDWDLETKRSLLAKAYEALPEGGAVVVYEAMIDDDRRANAFGLLTSLHMLLESPGGFDYSGADCVGWMADAGFGDCVAEPLEGPVSLVVGYK